MYLGNIVWLVWLIPYFWKLDIFCSKNWNLGQKVIFRLFYKKLQNCEGGTILKIETILYSPAPGTPALTENWLFLLTNAFLIPIPVICTLLASDVNCGIFAPGCAVLLTASTWADVYSCLCGFAVLFGAPTRKGKSWMVTGEPIGGSLQVSTNLHWEGVSHLDTLFSLSPTKHIKSPHHEWEEK